MIFGNSITQIDLGITSPHGEEFWVSGLTDFVGNRLKIYYTLHNGCTIGVERRISFDTAAAMISLLTMPY